MVPTLITWGIPVALFFLVIGTYQHLLLIRNLGLGREGLLLFWQALTLKAWVAGLIIYVLLNTSLGPFPAGTRQRIILGFVLLLVAQAVFTVVTSRRWRKHRRLR